MSGSDDLLKHALESAKTGWNRYIGALLAVNLALSIDLLTGRKFLTDQAEITIFGFEVLRPAFSFTYSVLFGAFVIWAVASARAIRQIVDDPDGVITREALVHAPEYRLWNLSPVNPSKWPRLVFWTLFAWGLLLLALLAGVHLVGYNVPAGGSMGGAAYRGIGVLSALVFAVSLALFRKRLYEDWEYVRNFLEYRMSTE